MLKKLSVFICLVVICSSANIAKAQNYTLQTNQTSSYQNPVSNTSNYKTTGFCDAFGKGFSDSINPKINTANTDNRIAMSGVNISSYDPYMLEIDGTKYMLIKENNDGIFNEEDILGYQDSKNNIFHSLKPLDINNDNKLTGDELTNANVRLVKIDKNGKLLYSDKIFDYNNENIKFISLKGLRKSWKNNGSTGNFGLFDAVVYKEDKTSKIVTGIVTFETKEELKKYF